MIVLLLVEVLREPWLLQKGRTGVKIESLGVQNDCLGIHLRPKQTPVAPSTPQNCDLFGAKP